MQGREHRDSVTNQRIKVGGGATPERTVEPIDAVMRDWRGDHTNGPQQLFQFASPRTHSAIVARDQVKKPGQVFGGEPEPLGFGRVSVEQHHPTARHPTQLP
jgi:hypothetical protein